MENLDLIVENYKRLSDDELVKMANNPASLRQEIIPHLQSELINRNKEAAALLLSEYLASKPKTYKDFTETEMVEMIHTRISGGGSVENIKIDLKQSGINILDYFGEARTYEQQQQMDYIESLKEEGYDEEKIGKIMKGAFDLEVEETNSINSQVQKKGKHYMTFGLILVIVFGGLTIIQFSIQNNFTKLFILLIITGIALIVRGDKLSK